MTWSQENCLVMNHCLYLRVTGKGFYRERILCAQIIFFRESIPFLYRRKGIFIFYDSCHASRRCVKMLVPNLSVFPEYAFL